MSTDHSQTRDTGIVQSVDRAVTILELLAQEGEAGVTTAAEALGVHKSTAFRLIGTLEARGMVEQTDDRGKYRLGIGLIRMAGTTAARIDIVQASRPIGKRLAADTGETVNLAVLVDASALYLDQIAGAATLQPYNWVGQRIPLHATSNGKVLAAALDADEVDRLLPSLQRYTDRTITRRRTLHRELAEVRRDGYAVTADELEEGMTALAAPVRDAHGEVIASLSVSGSSFRLTPGSRDEIVALVVAAADEVSAALGWAQPAHSPD